jgi:hypothetical protein
VNNGNRTQFLTTIISAVFAAGILYARIGSSAAAMRASMETIRQEQIELRKLVESFVHEHPRNP